MQTGVNVNRLCGAAHSSFSFWRKKIALVSHLYQPGLNDITKGAMQSNVFCFHDRKKIWEYDKCENLASEKSQPSFSLG